MLTMDNKHIIKSKFDKDRTIMIKGVAILLLLFHHLFLVKERLLANGVHIPDNVYEKMYPIVVQARICVWIFVFFSGYGLAKKYEIYQNNKNNCRYNNDIKFVISSYLNLMKKWWIVLPFMMIVYAVFVGDLAEYYQHSVKLLVFDIVELNDFFGYQRVFGSWYFSLAQIIILLLPVLYSFCKKYGYLSIIIFYVWMQFIGEGIVSTGGGAYLQYALTLVGGVVVAQENMMEKLLIWMDKRKYGYLWNVSLFIVLLICFLLRYKNNIPNYFCGFYELIICFIFCVLLSRIENKLFAKIFRFLGRHSAVLFMTNVFFYIELPDIVYFTHNPFGAYISLIGVCAAFSLIIKKVEAIIHYDQIITSVENKVLNLNYSR